MRQVPTLLLPHGGPGFDHSGFKPGFTEMATVVQLVYLDLRGNGRSDAGPANKGSLEQ
jgi:pimeloyl-ACP methyl ester carboxylesterase